MNADRLRCSGSEMNARKASQCARRKLGAYNKHHAAIIALRERLLRPATVIVARKPEPKP